MKKTKENSLLYRNKNGHFIISIPLIPALLLFILLLSAIFIIKQKVDDNREKEAMGLTESLIYARKYDEIRDEEYIEADDEPEIVEINQQGQTIAIQQVETTSLQNEGEKNQHFINGVPFIDQMEQGYPTGCEAVSATMVARFAGYNIDVSKIVDRMPKDTQGKRIELNSNNEEVYIAEDPFRYFVGDPLKTSQEGSYGCYSGPVITALNNNGILCINLSGESIETIYSYIAKGRPVIVWCTLDAKDLIEGDTWQFPDGRGEYKELIGEHCAVLIGYDDENVYLNDPIAGKNVSQPRDKFENNWVKLHSQAIIIK